MILTFQMPPLAREYKLCDIDSHLLSFIVQSYLEK